VNFSNPEFLLVFLAAIPYAFFVIFSIRNSEKEIHKFFSKDSIKAFFKGYSIKKAIIRFFLVFFSLFFAIVALSLPNSGTTLVNIEAKVVDIMIAVDVSPSMIAQDIHPSRFSVVKEEISRILRLTKARVSLIPFSGNALLTTPFTRDLEAVGMILSSMEPGFINPTGTDFEILFQKVIFEFDNIKEISKEFAGDVLETPKILVIMTDGDILKYPDENTINELKKREIELWVEVFSSDEGAKVPFKNEANSSEFIQSGGEDYISKPDKEGLRNLISKTGGFLFYYDGSTRMTQEFVEKIGNRNENARYKQKVELKQELFPYFLILSAILLSFSLGI
jgi:Ca-activated chloride channel family protein